MFSSKSPVKGLAVSLTPRLSNLHGLEDDVSLTYVVQRLAAVYGMR